MDRSAAKDVPAAATDWLKRPFARTFDLISSEYGWKDSDILDLTMARMRQVRDVILTRQDEEYVRALRVEEAKVRATTTAVYAAAGNEPGVKAAAKFRLLKRDGDTDDPTDTDDLPDTSQVVAALGGGSPLYSREDILAEAERQRAEAEANPQPEVTWVVKRDAD